MPTTYIPRTTVTATTYTGRVTTPSVVNTVAPIVTGFWNGLLTWSENGKFWNDSGDVTGLASPNYVPRIIP